MGATVLGICTMLLLSAGSHPATLCVLTSTGQAKGHAKNDARAAIEKLVNHNPVPRLVGDKGQRDPIFDVKYDWAEYHRVWMALRELAPKAEALWPELVKHLDDERYCMTALTWSDNTHNLTVGDVCHELISNILSNAYYQHLKPNSLDIYGRMGRPDIARDKKKLKSWCEARRDKPLYELQMEACEWAVKRLTKSEDLPRVSNSTRRAWIAAIKAEIQSLTKSKLAVPSEWFRGEEYFSFSAAKAQDIRKRHQRKEK